MTEVRLIRISPGNNLEEALFHFAEEPAPFQNSNGRNDVNIMAGSFLF